MCIAFTISELEFPSFTQIVFLLVNKFSAPPLIPGSTGRRGMARRESHEGLRSFIDLLAGH